LPKVTTAKDAVGAHAAVLAAVAGGEITPGEGGDVMRLLESFSRTIEVSEPEERLAILEQQIQSRRSR
jgi:hypothetical protein